jgi:CheY-like chemotaxis protein
LGLAVLWAGEVGRTSSWLALCSPLRGLPFQKNTTLKIPITRRFQREPRTANRVPVRKDSGTLPLSVLKVITTVASSANARESTLVIIVDDDASVANSTCRLIRSFGMRGEAFLSGADLLNSGRATEASCLILDVCMPNLDGFQLQRRLKEIRPTIPVIFFSAQAGKKEEDQALRSGAVAFLRKPVHKDHLLRAICVALKLTSQAADGPRHD